MDAEHNEFARHLVRSDGSAVSRDVVTGYFSGKQWCSIDDRGDEVFVTCDNEDTGVRFHFVWSARDKNDDLPFIRRKAGLVFEMALIRPGFFALEAMPLVADFCRQSNLRIKDATSAPDASTLVDEWHRENQHAVHRNAGGAPRLSVPREKSVEWWKYQRQRAALERDLVREDVFVPSILVLKEKLRLDLFFAVAWTQAIPIVLPRVDQIIVDRASAKSRKKPKLFRISYAQIVAGLGEWLKPFDGPVPGLRILRKKDHAAALKVFNTLPVLPADDYAGLSFKFIPASANFVDSEDQRPH